MPQIKKRNILYLYRTITEHSYICINISCTEFRGLNHVLEISLFCSCSHAQSLCNWGFWGKMSVTICFIILLLQELIFKEILILTRNKTGLVWCTKSKKMSTSWSLQLGLQQTIFSSLLPQIRRANTTNSFTHFLTQIKNVWSYCNSRVIVCLRSLRLSAEKASVNKGMMGMHTNSLSAPLKPTHRHTRIHTNTTSLTLGKWSQGQSIPSRTL